MKTAFPADIESLDCNWLTRVLLQCGQLRSGRVTGLSSKAISGGYTSTLFRLLPTYDEAVGPAPTSMIVKFHSRSKSIRTAFERLDIYQKEVRFYQFIEPGLNLPVPACYTAEYDSDSGDFVLLLQDLSAARPATWEPDPISDIRIALPQLAKIHAQFWGDPRLEQFDWIVEPTRPPDSMMIKTAWVDNLARVKKRYRNQWPEKHWRVCDKIVEQWEYIMQCLVQDTHTLVHTDSHLGQMFFPTDDLPQFFLFDWQYPSETIAAEDVAHLIANDLSVEQRREYESELIDLYHESLCEGGVTDLSRDRLWFQCRLSAMWLILMEFRSVAESDLLQILKAEAEEDGEDWRDWVFGQLGATIEDWNLSDAIDQAVAEARSQ